MTAVDLWERSGAPGLERAFTVHVELAAPMDLGQTPHGHRRVIPITGGTVTGPDLTGTVLPGGADWNLVRPDGITHLWARYTIRTSDGVLVMVTNEGWGTQDDAVMAAVLSGGATPAAEWYCRTHPRFEVGDERHAWLGRTVFVGDLRRPERGDRVVIDIHRVT